MVDLHNIKIYRNDHELIIDIMEQMNEKKSTLAVLNYSGEVIEKKGLSMGTNTLDIRPFIDKNYAIRVTNGNNVVVQKI